MKLRLPALFRRDQPPSEERSWIVGPDYYKLNPNWYQTAADLAVGYDISSNTAVYTCTNILSQEVASLNIYHWREDETGARTKLNSAAARTLRKPNEYQTSSDFWLYMMRGLLLNGTSVAVGVRNNRNEIVEVHPMPPRSSQPQVTPEGEVFYSVGNYGDALFRASSMVPSRNVFNPRLNCNRHPLIGETPITAFVMSAVTGSALQRFTSRFFQNMSRPSGMLSTPKTLTTKQAEEIRSLWNSKGQADNAGGTPVMHSDLKWSAITMSAVDAENIATYQLSVADVAMAYRVPLFMLGDLSKITFKTVEALMRLFYTSSLRFYLEHLENCLNAFFGLDGVTEYLEFDIEAGLLRAETDTRITAWTKAVQGGIMMPNEARAKEGLPPKPGGDRLFLQKQMVPIDLIEEIIKQEANKPAPVAAAPAPAPVSDTSSNKDIYAMLTHEVSQSTDEEKDEEDDNE